MKTKDITDLVADARKWSEGPYDPWEDYIDWKAIQAEGYTTVRINGTLHTFHKYGLKDTLS